MKYPASLLLPVLMLLDYFGTVLGSVKSRDRYDQHFVMEHYELNPIWQRSITEAKWFNPRHLAFTVIVSASVIVMLEIGGYPTHLAEGFLGATLTSFAVLTGRHLSNLLTFRYVARHPGEITGRVTMAHPFVVMTSGAQYLSVLIPLVVAAAITTSPFVVGSAIGAVLVLVWHIRWAQQARRRASLAATEPSATN